MDNTFPATDCKSHNRSSRNRGSCLNAKALTNALGGRWNGRRGMAKCPGHDDRTPSLSIDEAEDGTLLVHCHAGCEQALVWNALVQRGLVSTVDHTPKATNKANGAVPHNASLPDWEQLLGMQPSDFWDYKSADGKLLGYVARVDHKDCRKKILPLTHDGQAWRLKGFPEPRPLYRLDALAAAPPDVPVLLCEGEKTCCAAVELLQDHVVMTWPGGTNAVEKVDWEPLKGRCVTMWPDADETGRKAMNAVATILSRIGARSIRVVKAPDELPEKWDLADPIPPDMDIDRLITEAVEVRTTCNPSSYDRLTLTLSEWAELDIPERQYLLGSVFTTTSRAMFSADTGLGKTHIGFAIGFAMAGGKPFCHWAGHDPARVLLVDGEMPIELVKERLADAERRGGRPANLHVLCRENAKDMPSLDTKDGQDWLDGLIEHLGGIDFMVLDNVMSLTQGDMKEDNSWQPVIPWLLSLTSRRIGVLWIHHTGHDKSRGYGTKTREWQMDFVMIGERINDSSADIAVKLTFPKARQRKPDNRADFDSVTLRLANDRWEAIDAPRNTGRMPKDGDLALRTLREAIEAAGQPVSGGSVSTRGVKLEVWRHHFNSRRPLDGDDKKKAEAARRQGFKRAREHLQEAGHIEAFNDWYWPLA